MEAKLKRCGSCGKKKLFVDFPLVKRILYGEIIRAPHSWCRSCKNSKELEYRREDKKRARYLKRVNDPSLSKEKRDGMKRYWEKYRRVYDDVEFDNAYRPELLKTPRTSIDETVERVHAVRPPPKPRYSGSLE